MCRTNVSVSTWRGSLVHLSEHSSLESTVCHEELTGMVLHHARGCRCVLALVLMRSAWPVKKKNEGCCAFSFAFVIRFSWPFLLITWTDSCYILIACCPVSFLVGGINTNYRPSEYHAFPLVSTGTCCLQTSPDDSFISLFFGKVK